MSATTYWTLENAGTEKSFEDWGLTGLKMTFRSQEGDTCSFHSENQAVDGTPKFAKKTVCIVRGDRAYDPNTGTYSGGRTWFYGLLLKTPRRGTHQAETVGYDLVGPSWYLQNLPFEQYRRYWAGKYATWSETYPTIAIDGVNYVRGDAPDHDGDVYSRVLHTTVVLNQDEYGVPQTLADQVREILDFAIAAGATFTYDSAEIDAQFGSLQLPTNERPDVPCQTALETVLSWLPDCETWFDYNNALPVFHVMRRANLTTTTLDMAAGTQISGLEIEDRDDLRKAQVSVTYSRPTEINGQSFVWTFEDVWPETITPDDPFNKLRQSVDLVGYSITTMESEVAVEALPAEFWADGLASEETINWWKSKEPSLEECDVQYVTDGTVEVDGEDVTLTGGVSYPNELVSGTLAEWMGVGEESVTITAKITFKKPDGLTSESRTFSARFIATDAVSKVYNSSVTNTYAEEVPGMSGFDGATRTPSWNDELRLSKKVWEALDQPQFEGSFLLTAGEPMTTVMLGMKINISNGVTDWATMAMPVKQVTVDADSGQVTVGFGPNRFLTSGELVDLMRVTRVRFVSNITRNRAYGSVGGGATGPTKGSAKSNTSPGSDATQDKLAVQGATVADRKPTLFFDGPANSLQLASRFATGATAGAVDTSKPRINITTSHLAGGEEARFQYLYVRDYADGCKVKRCKVLRTEWELAP